MSYNLLAIYIPLTIFNPHLQPPFNLYPNNLSSQPSSSIYNSNPHLHFISYNLLIIYTPNNLYPYNLLYPNNYNPNPHLQFISYNLLIIYTPNNLYPYNLLLFYILTIYNTTSFILTIYNPNLHLQFISYNSFHILTIYNPNPDLQFISHRLLSNLYSNHL